MGLQWTAKYEEVGDTGDLIGGKEIADRIWLPDTFFVNERSSEFKETFLKISKDGTVLYSRRTRVTFTEHGQDFTNFPFDGKMFALELESYSFTGKDILYNWKDFAEELKNYEAFKFSPEIGFYEFSLVGHKLQTQLLIVNGKSYSRVWAEICLERDSGYYFSILFTPLFLVTILTLIIFWMNMDNKFIILLITNMFIIIYKIWFRVTQLPPIPGSVLACDFIDACLSVSLGCLGLHIAEEVFFNCNSSGYNRQETEASNIINMDQEISGTVNKSTGCRCFGIYIDRDRIHVVLKILIPVVFIIVQVCFWLRVAAVDNSQPDFERFVKS